VASRILKQPSAYLRKTVNSGLVHRSSASQPDHPEIQPNALWGYVDSDWAGHYAHYAHCAHTVNTRRLGSLLRNEAESYCFLSILAMNAACTRESTRETRKHVFLVQGSPSVGVHPVCTVCTLHSVHCVHRCAHGVHMVCTSLFANGTSNILWLIKHLF
jgi:hypothetical protein